MSSDKKGTPTGINKSEGTGVPDNFEGKDLQKDKELTNEYTQNDEEIADNVRTNNPNRNTDKPDATNAGGYKN